jgi:hypothetical protein
LEKKKRKKKKKRVVTFQPDRKAFQLVVQSWSTGAVAPVASDRKKKNRISVS